MKSIVALFVSAALAVFVSALVAPSFAHAQAAAPTAEQRVRAREAYTRGQQLFDAGQFEQAQASFEEAYAQVPNPVVLLGVASAQERRGLRAESRATLERYLREAPNARDREQIEARIATLPAAPVAAAPVAAAPVATTPPTATTPPATTTVSAEAEVAAASADVDAQATEAEADVAATEAEIEEGAEQAEGTPAPAEPAGPSTAVWVLAAVGAVGLVTGTVFGFMALSRQSDFDAAPSLSAADEGEAFALVADVSFAVALAGGIAAIVLYATEGSSSSETNTASLRILPTASPQGGGVMALGRF